MPVRSAFRLSRFSSSPPRLALALLMAGMLGLIWQAKAGPAQAVIPVQSALEDPTPTLAPGTGGVAGIVWQDLNANGIRETGEPPLGGALLSLSQQGGTTVATGISGEDGRYRLVNLAPSLYQLVALPPPGYQLTTLGVLSLYVTAGTVLSIDFGAQFIPTSTPTATPIPQLNINDALPAACGGIIEDDTHRGANNVSSYGCWPYWTEDGPEVVYRIALTTSQTVTAAFIRQTADLDLFLLRTAYPDTCVAAGDNFLSYQASPGFYYLAIDGYQGSAGSFVLRLDCPREVQATETPRPTSSPTPTRTFTPTPGPTVTPTATLPPHAYYLPWIMRENPIEGTPVTLEFQQGLSGYNGVSDTTLNAWYPDTAFGGSTLLSLRYNQQTMQTTHMVPTLRFDLSLLPAYSQISRATLRLYALQSDRLWDIAAETRGLLVPWRSDTATWLLRDTGLSWNQPGAQGSGTDHMTWRTDSIIIEQMHRWYQFDVTALVASWISNPGANHGLVLLSGPGTSAVNLQVDFASSEYSDRSLRPRLVVTYSVPVAAGGGQ